MSRIFHREDAQRGMAATKKYYREGAKQRSCAKKFNSYVFFAKLRFFAPSR